ncbi:MAG TPA: hypothetical protein VHM19_13715, partial [Polyangiales bacterium]|nr:hypothetical protein [Polyangiales bacterium]
VGQTGTLMHAENTAQWDILVNSGTYQLSRSVPMTLGPVTGYDNPASPYCFDNSYSYNGTASTSHFCTVSESSSLGRLASAFQSF